MFISEAYGAVPIRSSVWCDVLFSPPSYRTSIAVRPRSTSVGLRSSFASDFACDPTYTAIYSSRRYVVDTNSVSPHPFRRDDVSAPIYDPNRRLDRARGFARKSSFRTTRCYDESCVQIRSAYRLGALDESRRVARRSTIRPGTRAKSEAAPERYSFY